MIDTIDCPLRGVRVPIGECVDSCPAPEQRVVCAMEVSMQATHRGNAPARLPRPTDSERDFQAWVTATARANGYRVHVTLRMMRRGVNSTGKGGGWPDLVFVGKGRLFFAELKAAGNALYDNQRAVIEELRAAGQTVYVWYPTDYEAVLTALA